MSLKNIFVPLAAILLSGVAAQAADPFDFVALGDTTYAIPADDPLYAELIVQGHFHEFTVDRPVTELDLDAPEVRHPNLTRLQVYSWPDMKAVRVTVDVAKPWVFGFEPLYGANSVSPHSDTD